jgi:hypothetical protein
MKKNLLFIVALLFVANIIKAQLPSGSYSDYFREGSFLLLEENYDLALKNFLEAYKIDSSSANINFNVGYCYLNSSTKKGLAERPLAKAITNIAKNYRQDDPSEKSAPPLAHFYYAKALHINYKFDEAAAQYDIFEKQYAKSKDIKEEIAFNKAQTVYAKELVAAPINVQIQNLGDSINSEYPDFSPVLSADERMIIYTTRRNTSTGGEKTPDGQFFEDVVVAYKDDNGIWSSPKSIGDNINTNGHEGSINLTPDGQTLIIYRDDNGNGNIYYSEWDGRTWGPLQSFGSDINSKYWETHGCLTADRNTLYFVSERPGGFGGRDIYRCKKLPNGKWSLAQNLGPTINTKYDEDAVFIHPFGDLIFASRGHKSMGGFDIFVSSPDEDGKFTAPENMHYPINTPDDDVFFVTSPDGKRGYFSSANDKGYGEKDIYVMSIPDAKEKPLALFKGSIVATDGEKLPEDIVIIVTDKETGEIVGQYRPKENGTFSTILPPNKNYNFSYTSKGEEFYNEDLFVTNDVTYQEIKKEINLEPINLLGKVKVKDKAVILNTIVLNNPKDKQPVPNAKITLTEKGGADTKFDVDAKGKKDATTLAIEKSYTIYAEANGKKSATNSFNTIGVKGSKSITEVLYIDEKAAKTFDLFLNVLVVNKNKKPLADSKVTLTGNDGSKYEGTTDAKGRLKNIELEKDVNYDLIGENNGVSSEKQVFTTMNVNAKKSYDKTIVMDANAGAVVNNNHNQQNNNSANYGCGSAVTYKHLFTYNKNETDEAQDWTNLIDGIVSKTKECNPTVKILSSASQVPTHAFANNHDLAKSRVENLEAKIKAAVNAKGGDANKIVFKQVAQVRGPIYESDYQNKAKYEPFQYVKVIAR